MGTQQRRCCTLKKNDEFSRQLVSDGLLSIFYVITTTFRLSAGSPRQLMMEEIFEADNREGGIFGPLYLQ